MVGSPKLRLLIVADQFHQKTGTHRKRILAIGFQLVQNSVSSLDRLLHSSLWDILIAFTFVRVIWYLYLSRITRMLYFLCSFRNTGLIIQRRPREIIGILYILLCQLLIANQLQHIVHLPSAKVFIRIRLIRSSRSTI